MDEQDPATLSDESIETLREFRDRLSQAREAFDVAAYVQPIADALEAERLPHPTNAMMAALVQRIPVFALFGPADRDLAYVYDLAVMTAENIPAALRNLAVSWMSAATNRTVADLIDRPLATQSRSARRMGIPGAVGQQAGGCSSRSA